MKSVLTVCWGNILRSVFLELRLKQELRKRNLEHDITVFSRGIMGSAGVEKPRHPNVTHYPTAWKHSAPLLTAFGIVIPKGKEWVAVDKPSVESASIILAPDYRVLRSEGVGLLHQFPEQAWKMMLFSSLVGETFEVADCKEDDTKENFERLIYAVEDIAVRGTNRLVELLYSLPETST
jgi:protein-tyrosine-phosphatase